jgi:Uma2 family endonuclease
MSHARRIHRYTYADYVALEAQSPTKHEFLDGEIYAMAGGSEEHSALAAEILRLLGNAIGDRPCRAHTSDLRIYVEDAGLATFPDAAVICGPLAQHGPSPRATALNPTVLVEVTSDSSEEYDTTTKLDAYRTIPTLRAYLVVSHRERRLTLHERAPDGAWLTRVAIAGGRLTLDALALELAVDTLYRGSAIA